MRTKNKVRQGRSKVHPESEEVDAAERFGDILRRWRKQMEVKQAVRLAVRGKRAFGQSEAARWLGVPQRTYEGWERKCNPKVPQALVRGLILKKIAESLRVKRGYPGDYW